MKKLLAIVLAAVMVLSLAACGGGGGGQAAAPGHDPVTYLHSTTGKITAHNFVDGKCTRCDETTIFFQDQMPKHEASKYVSSNPGTVEEFYYDTRAYYVEEFLKGEDKQWGCTIEDMTPEDPGEIHIKKRAFVYLPAGYDPNRAEPYNVFYLMHGSTLDEGYWLAKGDFNPSLGNYTGGYITEALLDYVFDKGIAEDAIIVCPTVYAGQSFREDYGDGSPYGKQGDKQASFAFCDEDGNVERIIPIDNNNMLVLWNYTREFKNDLMPAIAEHYNTYAKSGSLEDLIAARDHQAYAGLSLGSMTGYVSIWMDCLDVISYIGNLSGSTMGAEVDTLADELKQYPINYWYVTQGSEEGLGELENMIKLRDLYGFQDGCDIANGDTCAYMTVNGGAHNYATWITALYNMMHVFFK